MKKIVFLENAINYGGAKIATINQAYQIPRYSEEKVETVIVDVYGFCKPFVDACAEHKVNLIIVNKGGTPKILSSRSFVRTWINRFSYVPEFLMTRRKVQRILADIEPDYIFVNTERTLAFLFGYKSAGKIVFYAHFWYLKNQITRTNRFLFKRLVDRFICVSEATRQALYNNGVANLERIFVAHNSIDEKMTQVIPAVIPASEGCIKLLHCGGFTMAKGQHISLEVARRLKEKGINFKLIFTGIIYYGAESQSYYDSLVRKVKMYDLSKEVFFIVGHSNVYEYIQAADILIHPSSTEGLGLAIMEAQIMRKPVIANGVGGVIDLIHDGYTGFIPNYNSVDEFVSKIVMLQDSDTYNYIAENAYNFASRSLTVKQQIDKILMALLY